MRRLKAFLMTVVSFAIFILAPYTVGLTIFKLFIHTWPATLDPTTPICVLLWVIGFAVIGITGLIVMVFSVVMKEWYAGLKD